MSVQNAEVGGSTEVETESGSDDTASISPEAARRVQQKAKARQSTRIDDDQVGVPHETTIEGKPDFFDQLFDENGMAFDSWWEWKSFDDDPLWEDSYKSGEKRRALLNHPGGSESRTITPEDDPEAFLSEVAPERLENIDEKFGDLPGTRAELIEVQARKAAKDLDEDEYPTESNGLVITKHQDEREDIWSGVDDDDEHVHEGSECPECGSTNTSSYQQQTGGADEGMTGFHNCSDCGKSWRTGYGA